MLELTAEEFAQRAFDLNLIEQRDLESVWGHFGTRNVPTEDFQNVLLQREYMTNYQVERLLKGEKAGFYYGDYKVLYLIGAGTFARVYRAERDGKVHAVKVLRKRHAEKPPETKKFLREGEMGLKLKHPNIVPIYEVHSIRHTHFLVMEFVEGQSLREFVQIRRKIEPAEAVEIMLGIVSGLHHAWEKGITHRDLKLSNVLMSSDGVPMMVDFGLAGIDGDAGNARTVDYAGLEKLTNADKGDSRSDIYFTGCMFYHLLTGRQPLANTKEASRFREVVPLRQIIPDIPLAVESVVNRAMQIDVKQRHQTQLDLLIDLRKARKALDPEFADGSANQAIIDPSQMKRILIVESNEALQTALRSGLKKSGYRPLLVTDAERAQQRIDRDVKSADALIISLASLGKAGLELHRNLLNGSATGKLAQVLLFGKSQAKFKSKLDLPDHVAALSMPLKMSELREQLAKLLPAD